MKGRARAVAGRWRALPPGVRVAVLVGLLNGLVWALLLPPLQAADETAHAAYVQHLAETGHRPLRDDAPEFSTEEQRVFNAIGTGAIIGRPTVIVPITPDADRQANEEVDAAREFSARANGGGRSVASSQPPLAYALYVVPYEALSWTSFPTRLLGMRLLSVLLFAATCGLVALLAAELLPGRRWAPLVAGCAVALQPSWTQALVAVNPDGLMATVSAAVLLGLVRAIRHGLTPRRAAVLGALLAAGTLTKLTFAPVTVAGIVVLLVLLARQVRATSWQRAARTFAAGLAVGVPLALAFVAYTAITGGALRPPGTAGTSLPLQEIRVSALDEMGSYTWQLWLPRMPWMLDMYAGTLGPRSTWIDGLAGRYGWLDSSASQGVKDLVFWIATAGFALFLAALVAHRDAVLRRRGEALALGAVFVALAAAIGKGGYDYRRTTGLVFEQVRYLVPIAGLYGGAWAIACAGLGRRWAPVLAAVLVGLFCVHDVNGLLVVAERYYV